jgi:DNA-binding NarL/FixJ family response regulator
MAPRQRTGRGLGVRLLHVEVDELILLGLQGAVPPEWVVTSLRTIEACVRPPATCVWDACLLGIRDDAAGVRDALACLAHLRRLGCPLLVWMPADSAQYVPAMKALGVTGFVSRSASVPQVRGAILDVIAGDVFIDRRLQSGLPLHQRAAARLDLTELQQRVACLYVLHGNRRLVARDLHVSENTVKYHLRRIYAKTGTSSVHELHKLLLAWGWAQPEGS